MNLPCVSFESMCYTACKYSKPVCWVCVCVSLSLSLQTAMEAMGLIAIIVNCYLIGQCGQLQRLFPWLSPEMAIISIVILEVQTLLQ